MPEYSEHEVEMTKSPNKRRSMEVTRQNFQTVLKMQKGNASSEVVSPTKNSQLDHVSEDPSSMVDSSFVEIVDVVRK